MNDRDNDCYDSSYCTDMTGSYTCSCPADFELKADGRTCQCKFSCVFSEYH